MGFVKSTRSGSELGELKVSQCHSAMLQFADDDTLKGPHPNGITVMLRNFFKLMSEL